MPVLVGGTIGLPLGSFLGIGISKLYERSDRYACSVVSENTKIPCEAFAQRALTPEEKELARKFFGSGMDLEDVRLYQSPVDPDTAHKTTAEVYKIQPKRIYFYGVHNLSGNYANEETSLKTIFMHELTHVWQHQNGHAFDGLKQYAYVLEPGTRFENMPTESQAAIVEDYTKMFLQPISLFTHMSGFGGLNGTHKEQALYADAEGAVKGERYLDFRAHVAKVVEAQFPGAAELRRAQERLNNPAAGKLKVTPHLIPSS